jgi:hypothetical protein
MHAARRLVLPFAVIAGLALPASALAAYGAIAVNQSTGAWGISHDAPARWYAERQALRACRGECVVMVWARNRCAAVVVGSTGFVAGMGSTRRGADRTARRRAHDKHARELAWTCSG